METKSGPGRLTSWTIARFLVGNREATKTIIDCPHALWVGLVLVLSAGLARCYDTVWIPGEFWRLLLPVGASLAAATVLFGIILVGVRMRGPIETNIGAAYRAFVTLFWMTAPLAWLYGIPYERFLSEGDAVQANLTTLALVSLWRVLLAVRFTTVLTGLQPRRVFPLVMSYGLVVMGILLAIAPTPTINLMGGVTLSAADEVKAAFTNSAACFCLPVGPVVGIWALAAIRGWKPKWHRILTASQPSLSIWMKALAIVALIAWLVPLPWTQPEQSRRRRAEHLLLHRQFAEAIEFMSRLEPHDFPPHWSPPPRLGYQTTSPNPLDVLRVCAEQPTAEWVRTIYVDKLINNWGRWPFQSPYGSAKLLEVLPKLPEGPAIAAAWRDQIERQLVDESLTEADRDAWTQLLALADLDAANDDEPQ